MKHIARWGLVAVIFAVALVFFGSVICPPIAEREAETTDAEAQYPLQEDPGSYKALPGELQIEDRFPVEQTPPPDTAESFSTIKVTVIDDHGMPVEDALVSFISQRENGPAAHSWGRSDRFGKFSSTPLFSGKYQVRVQHRQYFITTSEPIDLPSETQTLVELRLSPAAFVSGLIHTASGRGVVHGELKLTDLNSGESIRVKVENMGTFRSPPLNPGYWSLSWAETVGGTPDATMRFALPLEHRQEREFRVVVPNNQPNQESIYDVGIRDYLK